MKRLLLAGLAFSALIMPAMAADMPLKALPPPPTWTGLYWGVNVGWIGSSQCGITNTGTDTGVGGLGTALSIGAIPGTILVSHSGFIGGGQIGYNWQIDPSWVWGVEADFQGSTANGSAGAAFLGGRSGWAILSRSPQCITTSSMTSAPCVHGSVGSHRRTCFGTVRVVLPMGKPNLVIPRSVRHGRRPARAKVAPEPHRPIRP
jgi:hypothetical protein